MLVKFSSHSFAKSDQVIIHKPSRVNPIGINADEYNSLNKKGQVRFKITYS